MAGKKKRTRSPSKKRSKNLGITSRTRARNRSTSEEEATAPSDSETALSAAESGIANPNPCATDVKPAHLNDEETIIATEFIQNHEALWNLKDDRYYDKHYKEDLWREMSELFSKQCTSSLKKWWKNQRDVYTKKCKMLQGPSGSAPRAMASKTRELLERLKFMRARVMAPRDSQLSSGFADGSMEVGPPTIDDDLSQSASALERSTESRGSSHPSRGRATFRTPSATVSRNPSREFDGPPGGHTARSSLRTSSPADSLSSHRSIIAPFGMTRLDDNVNMMQQMASVSRLNETEVQRERESMRKGWEDIRQQRQTLQLERDAIREREGELRREDAGRVDMNNVPTDSRHLLLQLGTVMGQMSPERKRNVQGQLASLLTDCIMMTSSTQSPAPPQQPTIPRALVENAQELLAFKDKLTGRTSSQPPPSASEPGRRLSSPNRPFGAPPSSVGSRKALSVLSSLPSTVQRAIMAMTAPNAHEQFGSLPELFDMLRAPTPTTSEPPRSTTSPVDTVFATPATLPPIAAVTTTAAIDNPVVVTASDTVNVPDAVSGSDDVIPPAAVNLPVAVTEGALVVVTESDEVNPPAAGKVVGVVPHKKQPEAGDQE